MRKSAHRWLLLLAFTMVFAFGAMAAQEPKASAQKPAEAQSQPAGQQPENPNTAIGNDLSTASHDALESAEHEENAQFKYSPAVRWIAKHLNGDRKVAYAFSLIVNFGLLALFFYMLLRSKLPSMFRSRTTAIQQSIREAELASAEAARRMSQVEARLAKLDAEVAEIRREAEQNVIEEEQRIRQAAEEDSKKVVALAEGEISAIARNARRELKSYAASLAVDLAARKIQVDDRTDHALVREFVDQLGKDGK